MQQNFINILLTMVLSFVFVPIFAQNGNNPFDLNPRLKEQSTQNAATETLNKNTTAQEAKNPFDLTNQNNSNTETSILPTEKTTTTANNKDNPFEIENKKNQATNEETIDSTEPLIEETQDTSNPFDLTASPTKQTKTTPAKEAVIEKTTPLPKIAEKTLPSELRQEKSNQRFLVPVVMFMLALLALLLTLFRSIVVKSYQAFLNDNILAIIYRERAGILISPYTILYVMFLINAGIFVFLLSEYYQVSIVKSRFLSLMLSIGLVFAIFFLKHLALNLLAFIFPIAKELKLYNFTIIIFGITIGILLVPINILIAYAPPGMTNILVYSAFGLVGLVYLFRSLRGLFIANRFLLFHKFHFLLYICTVEIAPIIIFLKLLSI